jgi:8-oxo-dGTP diphosphatase
MKKVLFATHNRAKLDLYKQMFAGHSIQLIGLDDLDVKHEVEEIGNDEQEIAAKKVTEYNHVSNLITISEDTGLYFEDLEPDVQPGTKINSINGVKLSEEERIAHYSELAKKHGGRLVGTYRKAVAIHNGTPHMFVYERKVVFVDVVSPKRNSGYPLNSVTITPEYNKYTVDLTDEENTSLNDKCHKEIYEFIKNTLDIKRIDNGI